MTPREEAERIAEHEIKRLAGQIYAACDRADHHPCARQRDAILTALRVAEARGEQRGRVQGLRDALEHVQFEICGPRCGHECCRTARSLHRVIAGEVARALDQPHTETRAD